MANYTMQCRKCGVHTDYSSKTSLCDACEADGEARRKYDPLGYWHNRAEQSEQRIRELEERLRDENERKIEWKIQCITEQQQNAKLRDDLVASRKELRKCVSTLHVKEWKELIASELCNSRALMDAVESVPKLKEEIKNLRAELERRKLKRWQCERCKAEIHMNFCPFCSHVSGPIEPPEEGQ